MTTMLYVARGRPAGNWNRVVIDTVGAVPIEPGA
jgi:hypothetical protein